MRLKLLAGLVVGFMAVACSSGPKERITTVEQFKARVKPGMTLDEVAEIAGPPKKTFPFASDMDPGFCVYEFGGRTIEIIFDPRDVVREVRDKQRIELGLTVPK